MYIEEFILVDIWIHCCTSWNLYYTVLYTELDWTGLNEHWKNAGLYTLATKEWDMWELLLDVQLTLEIE